MAAVDDPIAAPNGDGVFVLIVGGSIFSLLTDGREKKK